MLAAHRPRSIRLRLIASVLAVLTLVLAGSAGAVTWSLSTFLEDRVSERLESVRDQIQQAVALNVANQGGLEVGIERLEPLLGERTGLILVLDGQPGFSMNLPIVSTGQAVRESGRAPGEVVFVDGPSAAITVPTKGLRIALETGTEPVEVDSVVLVVSRSDDLETLNRLVRIGVLVGVLALGLLAVLTAVVVRAGLRPLTELADAVQAVGRGERGPSSIALQGSTETGQVAAAVREAFTARARAEDRLRSFVADASHELRTPLTKIGGWVDLYLQGGLRGEEGTQAAMEKVEAEVGRMGLLVEELSLLARLDAQVPLDLVELDLGPLVREVLDDAQVVSAQRDFTFHEPAAPVRVRGDAERLRRVLRNLVGNAVQHTRADAAVEVTLRTQEQTVLISVRDHGDGIPAEQLPKLFERFWRAEESRSRAQGGSGLGLAIVEAVVVAHGGTVSATSQTGAGPDQGTNVTISLPRLE
ncbi:sensor histidine kinase [Kineosporia babensis]|uniref:histidine kinase n=1 Tax=Kineosporia babensis TaxID=499548 RepID=A0A9X1NHL1_9ACTN|nr:ATP-binding protein [Kineosporia babensis]MCD5315157.1 HAMP domain-containing histidine kinase [Kineosporia babensis]